MKSNPLGTFSGMAFVVRIGVGSTAIRGKIRPATPIDSCLDGMKREETHE
jgi:hypothetical protein